MSDVDDPTTHDDNPTLDSTFTDDANMVIKAATLRTDPLLGEVLDDKYRILKALGRGAMGLIYLGEQMSTARKVAIKILQTFNIDEEGESWTKRDKQLLRFFQQEARTLARLNHPNVAQIYDASTHGEILYIAMEYIEGQSLRAYLKHSSRLNVKDTTDVLRGSCYALDATHKENIIHRDIKPENIMVVAHSNGCLDVKLLDFGIAILDGLSAFDCLTGAGEFAGTPAYMSPEQLKGEQLSRASDIYSLGVVAYEMLTGVNPFTTGRGPYMIASNHINLTPPPMRDVVLEVPSRIEAAIMKALNKDPHNRFSTAIEFSNAL